ncbi:MAG: NADH-quinone oxidoreductase subunit L [Candidatus Dormibacteria bacterium]
MTPDLLATLILTLPLAAALALVCGSGRQGRRWVGFVACVPAILAFGAAVWLAVTEAAGVTGAVTLWPWINAGGVDVGFTLQLDPLASFMTLVVTGVGSLILVYAVGYMWDDPGIARFFVYMDLFLFSMLLLVLAGNFVLLVVGWGMVGLSSYLLIGFWYERRTAVLAARKAFVMNVIGDVGMVFAALMIYWQFHTLDFAPVFAHVTSLPRDGAVILGITLLLLVGAVAKSAQLPLHTWLPDAMEGPTPVSALIHAATMVTAGVYLVARMHPLYAQAPTAAGAVAVIGALTAIFAASIAITQVDIKRVLAYSTMSQIGYMFLAVGVGAYSFGLFHLMTHAFFKALLFMAAGNVIHALADEQDIRRMGGLGRLLPWTRAAFLAGTAAISGLPLLSGFFSKDAILGAAYVSGPAAPLLWVVGLVTAVLTATYMFRLYFLTFHGVPRFAHDQHPHEAPPVMLAPVLVLAVLAVVGGYVQASGLIPGTPHLIDDFLAPVGLVARGLPEVPVWAVGLSALAGLFGLGIAWLVYLNRSIEPASLRASLGGLPKLLENKYYVDELYQATFIRATDAAASAVAVIDSALDSAVAQVPQSFQESGTLLRPAQSGLVRAYALTFLGAAVVIVAAMVLVR